MGQLEDMALFIRIVDAGSITKAAEQLNVAKSAVSRRLKELEMRLGVQLISRTTRKSNLTEAGVEYYKRAKTILDDVDILNEQVSGAPALIEGTLKLTAPLSFGLLHLNDVIHDYANLHPELRFELDFTDQNVDLIEKGYELAIRIGNLQDSSYQAQRLTIIRSVICASPEYLNKNGAPKALSDLKAHHFLQYSLSPNHDLELTDRQGQRHLVSTGSRMVANNGDFLLDMAVRGHGIVSLPTFIAYQKLKNKELVPLLQQFQLPLLNAYAVYPKNKFLSKRCRKLIELITQRFGDHPYWDED
ncbi:LysR family transcriptional regulator [Psychrobacter aquimaris]|uniref:LysR family transcriptional regulator n=1 Tax=Psychrobacter aquimaris TaxID=292733 RepID=UPI003FCF0304